MGRRESGRSCQNEARDASNKNFSNLPSSLTHKMATAPARSRLLALTRLRCDVFSTLYNPLGLRTGAKYLRARLRGPSMVNYYPQTMSFKQISAAMPEVKLVNFEEEQRLFDVSERKKRGKGAPKKAKSKGALPGSRCRVNLLTTTLSDRGQQTFGEEEEKVDFRLGVIPFWTSGLSTRYFPLTDIITTCKSLISSSGCTLALLAGMCGLGNVLLRQQLRKS